MKVQILLLFAFFTVGTISAQNYQTITGQILDKKTGKAVAYANIGIPEKGIGTTSGGDGRFTFKVPDYYANSTMIVSVIGYKTYRKSVKKITSPITVKLERTAYDLVEIEVMDEFRVENIIRKAVANIPRNYPTHPTKVLGFYRESRTDTSQRHIYMAEGVLNIYKNSYKSQKEGMVSLVQGRKINLRNPLDTVVRGGFSSGHMAAHRFDFVKNREDFIDEDYFYAYKYWIETVTSYNDRPVYVIAFDKDENQKNIKTRKAKKQSKSFFEKLFSKKEERLEARMRGKIYIDKESYAFIRAEFEITKKGLRKYNDYPLYAGNWTSNSYIVNYRQLGDKWYFSDALREGGWHSDGLYSNEIKITEINTEKAGTIPYLERLDRGQEFVDMTGHYDENFWMSYNITPMSAALSESVQQFKNDEKARQVFDPKMMRAVQELRDSMAIAEQLAKAEAIAKENNEEFKPQNVVFGEPGVQKEKENKVKVQAMFGLGVHMISTPTTQMGITYSDLESGETIVSETNTIEAKDFEIMAAWGFNIFFNKRWFVCFGAAGDFTNNIYKETSLGLGTQFNLSKQRPFLFKLAAQHSRIRYARELGATRNDYGHFKVRKEKFKADRIRLYYGSRTHNVKLSAELAIELKRHQELYIRGSYYIPFARRQDVYFRETGELFKKKERLAADDLKLSITRDDVPFKGRLMEERSIMVTVGFLFK